MNSFFDSAFWKSVAGSVVAAAAVSSICLAGRWSTKRAVEYYNLTSPLTLRIGFALMLALCLAANVAYIALGYVHPLIFLVLTIGFVSFLLWGELNRFWVVGVVSGDKSVVHGLDYEKALKLCRNGLAFAGLGADKITAARNFRDVMIRCNRPDRPIRFLLARPDSGFLRTAARHADVSEEEYVNKVRQSLGRIAELKKQRDFNIEVRFYPPSCAKPPRFRLMFIDSSLCLVSYYVLGEGSGEQLPQIHLRASTGGRDVESMFYPFSLYFEDMWEAAHEAVWDFVAYLPEGKQVAG
jgi:hypothetical protein